MSARTLGIAFFCAAVCILIMGHHTPAQIHGVSLPDGPPYLGFHNPTRVTIRGYTGDAMEPFITKDGKSLFFNNSNDPSVNTNLYYAARITDLLFDYKGEIGGVNTPALEGVPSLDTQGNFYFVSPRSYESTFSALYRGHYQEGMVTKVEIVPGVSLHQPGIVNFDAEISADGNTLYFVDGDFTKEPKPFDADLMIATRTGKTFQRDPKSAAIMRKINSRALEYAPCISLDGLELFFTRVDRSAAHPMPILYRAKRITTASPFDAPQRIAAISGYVEAPSLDTTGHSLYYHKKENNKFGKTSGLMLFSPPILALVTNIFRFQASFQSFWC